jgi:preprotein translocase subunit SecF
MFKFNREFTFMKHRKKYYLISVLLIVIGIGGGLIQGFNFGIDFTGGTMMQIDMKQEVAVEDVNTVLKANGITADIVHAGENNREIIIRTTQSLDSALRNQVVSGLGEKFGTTSADVLAAEQF